MHELGLAKDLAAVVFEKIKQNNNKKLKKICIVVGEASGIEKDFLEHSLKEHIFKGTELENVVIEFKIQKVGIRCKKCNKDFFEPVMKCNCGCVDFDILSGKEFFIEFLEFE